MFHLAALKSYRPIGIIIANWRWDEKAARQFRVHHDLFARVEFIDKLALSIGVRDDVIINVMLKPLACLREILLALVSSEDIHVMPVRQGVIAELLDDHRCLLLIDDTRRFGDEVLRVLPELIEHRLLKAG